MGQPLALGAVVQEEDDDKHSYRPRYERAHETSLPAQPADYRPDEDEGEKLAQIVACTEEPVVGSPLLGRKPARQRYDGRAGTHRLRPAVEGPHDEKADKEGHRRQPDETFGQAQHPHDEVGNGRDDEPRSHKPLDIGVVGHETIHKLTDGIGKQQRRAHDAQLLVVEHTALDYGGLHHIQPGAAYVIQTVPQGPRKKTLQSQFLRQPGCLFIGKRCRPLGRGQGPIKVDDFSQHFFQHFSSALIRFNNVCFVAFRFRFVLYANIKNIPDNRAIFLLEIYSSDTILQASGISNLFLHAAIAECYDTNR